MTLTPEELEKKVDEQIKEYGIEGNALVVREAIREAIFIGDSLGNPDNYNHVKDMVEIPESMFIEYFLPTIIRPALADKKIILVKKVGGWQTDFKVISDTDKSVLFICPSFIKSISIEENVKWGDKEISTNHLLSEVVNKSKLLADSGVNTNKANELVDGLSDLMKVQETDEWTKRWFQVFYRYNQIVTEIVRVHSDEFNKNGSTNSIKEQTTTTLSLDDLE